MPAALHLSKSRFCNAVQCPKMLWLKKYRPEVLDESAMDANVLRTGTEVGRVARDLLGPYVEVPYGDLKGMLAETKRLLAAGTPVIAEASFADAGNFCSVDLLLNHGGNRVEIYEVKSSTGVADIYYYDVAYQYYVLTLLGYEVVGAYLVHIDSSYVRQGELDLQSLFKINDLTEEVRSMQPEIAARIAELRVYMQQAEEPEKEIGDHCFDPYGCVCFDYCTRDFPHPNIFDIANLQRRSKMKLLREGIVSFADVEAKNAVNPNCMLQIQHELHDLPDEIDADSIRAFLDTLSYPLYFLDFETFQPAIPLYDGTHPYEQIVFQYSLHYVLTEDGELQHREFLARPDGDPRRAVAEHLVRDIPRDACVLAYNMSFEKGRIKALAKLYPDLAEHLMNIHDHIRDLMDPFRQKCYYNRAMAGSYSIKYVLPALFPDDLDLDYHNLEGVQNGADASAAFAAMMTMSETEIAETRAQLLKYCGLDTYAMVKVWEKLLTVIK